jgi:transcriptional regulator with PAS, ATPase and Fis domain
MAKVLELLGRITPGPEAGVGTAKREEDDGPEEAIVTQNPLMLNLIKQTRKIAASDIFVLVQGESGTGKELIARLIHDSSPRKAGPYLAINCAAIPETLLESELFGHEKGAFTGALQTKKGKLELASGGTLVLDEVSDMPLNLQAKLLRALEEHALYRVGGIQPIQVDLRIISLTNANLKTRIDEGKFREDLYYRLVHHTITLPPLRDRSEDVIPLIFHFAEQCCRKLQREIKGFSPGTIELLLNYPWPGNIRQLRNEIRRLANLAEAGQLIGADLLSEDIANHGLAGREQAPRPGGDGLKTEKQKIIALLERNQWNKSRTAREIGISFQGLYKKLKKLGISRPQAGTAEREPADKETLG